MRKQNFFVLSCLLCAIAVSGCTTPQPFYYQHSESKQARDSALPLQYRNITDERIDKEIDEIFENPTIEEVNKVVQQELKNFGIFSQIILPPETFPMAKADSGSNETPFIFQGTLKDLKWEILNYDDLEATAFAVGLLTGAVGGIIYGSTDIDVYGHAVMHIRIENPNPVMGVPTSTRNFLIDKKYVARVKETMTKFVCDIPETKAKMAGKALGDLMKQFNADLQKKLSD